MTLLAQHPPTTNTKPSTPTTVAITELLSHDSSCDPIHLHYYGPPSPGVRDDYFELSESKLVRKLNNLLDKNRFTVVGVPSLLGPVSRESSLGNLSTSLPEEAEERGGGDDRTPPTPSPEPHLPRAPEEDGGGGEEEPTDTDWEAEEEEMRRCADAKRRLARGEGKGGVTSSPLLPPHRNPSPSSAESSRRRQQQLTVLRDKIDRISISPSPSPSGKEWGRKEVLPWEGKEISIPSSCSSRSSHGSGGGKGKGKGGSDTLPPFPNVLQPVSSLDIPPLKLAFNTSSTEDDHQKEETTAGVRMEERSKILLQSRKIPSDSFSDATSATASLSACGGSGGSGMSSSSPPSSSSSSLQGLRKLIVRNNEDQLIRRMKVGEGENEWNGTAQVDAESSSEEEEEEETISGYLDDLLSSPPPMRRVTEEEMEEYEDGEDGEEEEEEEVRPSSAPLSSARVFSTPPPPPRTLDTLDLVVPKTGGCDLEKGETRLRRQDLGLVGSSSFGSKGTGEEGTLGEGACGEEAVETTATTTELGESMDGFSSGQEVKKSPVYKHDNYLGRHRGDVYETDGNSPNNSPSSMGSRIGGIRKRISRRMNRMRSHRKTLSCSSATSSISTKRRDNLGRNENSGVMSPLSFQSSLCRTKSEQSMDSSATPSQWQWQEKSMSSLSIFSASMPTPTRGDMSAIVTTPSFKKKKKKKKKKGRGWKIGKRNSMVDGCGKLRDRTLTSPTTVEEEEEMETTTQRVQWKLGQEDQQQHEADEAQPCGPQERFEREQRSDEYPMIDSSTTDCTDFTDTTDTTDTTHRRKRDYPHLHYRRQHEIQMNHRAMYSQELFLKLDDDVDFDEFIKNNRISFVGDFLLGKMLRERTRIQCKMDMLHSDFEMYVNLHGTNSQRSSAGAAFASSSTGKTVEVGGDGCRRPSLSTSSVNSTTTGDRTAATGDRSVLFAI